MNKGAKITIGVLGGLGIIAVISGFVWYRKNKRTDSDTTNKDGGDNSVGDTAGEPTKETSNSSSGSTTDKSVSDVDAVAKNLGGNPKKDADGNLTVPFNLKRNTATFFTNGRIGIAFNNTKQTFTGSWSDGGKTIVAKGKTFKNSNVWNNLLNVIK